LYNPAPKRKVGREQFGRRNVRYRDSSSDDGGDDEESEYDVPKKAGKGKKSKKKAPPPARRAEREEKKSEFEVALDKLKETCNLTAMRMVNLVACGMMMMSAVVRFGYLFD